MKVFLAVFATLVLSACSSMHDRPPQNSSTGYNGEQYPTKIKLEKERGYYSDNYVSRHN